MSSLYPALAFSVLHYRVLIAWKVLGVCSEASATPSCCWLMGKEPVSLIIPHNSKVSLVIPRTLFIFLDDQTSQRDGRKSFCVRNNFRHLVFAARGKSIKQAEQVELLHFQNVGTTPPALSHFTSSSDTL